MNLIDLLAPKTPESEQALAEVADLAESLQLQGQRNPPPLAESETRATTAFPPVPPNPPPLTSKLEILLPVTREYFASQGVELLPEDLAFLRWHLPKGRTARNEAIAQYLDNWRKGTEIEPVAHRKENAGRRAANSWLH